MSESATLINNRTINPQACLRAIIGGYFIKATSRISFRSDLKQNRSNFGHILLCKVRIGHVASQHQVALTSFVTREVSV